MERTIKECKIVKNGHKMLVLVRDSTGEMGLIGSYYPDELSFTEDEFIGLTLSQAEKVIETRDTAFLRS